MKHKMIIRFLIAILVYAYLIGCQSHTAKPDNRQLEGLPSVSREKGKHTQNAPPGEIHTDTAESDPVDFQPASVEQLQSALSGLESFRVFGHHFKMQDDQDNLKALKQPTFEYITNNIDPHLKLKKVKYDKTSEVYIASFLYMKAYLFWIHNDSDSARKTIAVLNRSFPQRHPDIKIHHFDKGEISLDDALDDFEVLIGPDTTKQ